MKKLLFFSAVSAVLIGLAQTSEAGVHIGIGFGLPLPRIFVTHPAPVVVEAAPVCVPASVVVVEPCAPVPVCVPAPVVVLREPYYYPAHRYGYYWHDGRGYHHGYRR